MNIYLDTQVNLDRYNNLVCNFMKNITFIVLFSLLCNLNTYAAQSNDVKSADSCNKEIVQQDVQLQQDVLARPPHFDLPLEVEQKVQSEVENNLFVGDQQGEN
jgi:hypothetical protein